MHALAATAVKALAKRAVVAIGDDPKKIKMEFPPWVWRLLVLNIVLFLPVLLYLCYTLNLLPHYAMIEDPSPPAYEPVALTDDTTPDDVENPTAPGGRKPLPPLPTNNKPISASVRNLHRMLYRLGGWRSLFRGILPAIVFAIAFIFVAGFFSAILPQFIATLAAHALTLPLSTAWLHIVISAPSKTAFWHRIPSLRKTFTACSVPLLAVWGSSELASWVPILLLPAKYRKAIGSISGPNTEIPDPTGRDIALAVFAIVLQFAVILFVTVPAEAVFRRVQASMLPEEHDTIIPFDRTFSGEVQPVVVGGPGFAHWRIALKTFDVAAWKRPIWLYVKIFVLSLAIFAGLMAVYVPQIILVYKKCKKD